MSLEDLANRLGLERVTTSNVAKYSDKIGVQIGLKGHILGAIADEYETTSGRGVLLILNEQHPMTRKLQEGKEALQVGMAAQSTDIKLLLRSDHTLVSIGHSCTHPVTTGGKECDRLVENT
jgi:hypothetical protein